MRNSRDGSVPPHSSLVGAVSDPAGYTWWIATRKEDLTPAETKQPADECFKQMAHSGSDAALGNALREASPTRLQGEVAARKSDR